MSLTCFYRNELSLSSLKAFSKYAFLAVRMRLFVLLRQSLKLSKSSTRVQFIVYFGPLRSV